MRELALERESKLVEMKEQMLARQKKLKSMEKDVASRHAAITRYDTGTNRA